MVDQVSDDFEAGDCVIFGMKTLHMSTTNTLDRFRISCDTRWQPQSHSIDERWAGSPTDGSPHRFFVGDDPAIDEVAAEGFAGEKQKKRMSA